jgi:hypothetical protein
MPSARRAQGTERLRTRQAFFRTALESARDRSINNIGIDRLIKLTVFVKDVQLKALLDSGAQGNYISRTAADRAGLSPRYKKNPYPLRVANGEPMPGEDKVTLEVRGAPIRLQHHEEKLDLDILGTAAHDVILGLPWLRKHNPHIDWAERTLRFDGCRCGTTTRHPTQPTLELVDEKEINNISSTHETRQDRAVDRADQKSPSATIKETKSAPPAIPDVYRQYAWMFKEELTAKALPKH